MNNVVLGWMKSDLTRMRDRIRPDKSEAGNINFPLALCVLSYMDCLGGFLNGIDKGIEDNMGKYINECFKDPEEYSAPILTDFFRNGLTHEYFSRGAISRNGKHPAIYKGRTYDLVLDAETLVNDFIDSLNTFIDKLKDEKYEMRMKEMLDKIGEFKEQYKDFIEDLGSQPEDNDQATPSSGPSGYSGPVNTTTLNPSLDRD